MPKRRGSREVSAQSPGSSPLELPDVSAFPAYGDGRTGGLSRGSERTLGHQEHFKSCRAQPIPGGGWTGPDCPAAGSLPISGRQQ